MPDASIVSRHEQLSSMANILGSSLRGPVPTCPPHEVCLEWAHRYLKDCVCSFRDEVSFVLGLTNVLCCGVAEVPQIITNFKRKSAKGVSVAFLMTWVLGDFCNLVGCYLEPSTLPTQFYTALLYITTTLVLVSQVIYYDHILKKPVGTKRGVQIQTTDSSLVKPSMILGDADAVAAPTSPRHLRIGRAARDLYYMSTRSLATSHTPSPPINPSSSSVLRAVVSSAFFVGGLNIHSRLRDFGTLAHGSHSGFGLHLGRKLLEGRYRDATLSEGSKMGGSLGTYLGWLMAAIYMGGPLPQICLNIRRGSVEGLNPLMFTFTLLGNVTYVSSILVRSIQWRIIKSNMPWLLDGGVSMLLDSFILCQFIYYYSRRPKREENKGGDYVPLQ